MEIVYYVYIMTNKPRGTLYAGFTNNLIKRAWQHKTKELKGFTATYNLTLLVYYEIFQDAYEAIRREKQIKNLVRRKKIILIENMNPDWEDLYENLRM